MIQRWLITLRSEATYDRSDSPPDQRVSRDGGTVSIPTRSARGGLRLRGQAPYTSGTRRHSPSVPSRPDLPWTRRAEPRSGWPLSAQAGGTLPGESVGLR